MLSTNTALELTHVTRSYPSSADAQICAVKDLSLTVNNGEFVALVGPSGCGKSTLLHLIGGLEPASSGTVVVNGRELNTLSESELNYFRRNQIGVVFQFFNLLPTLTVLENVMLRLELAGISQNEAKLSAAAILDEVGLSHRLNSFPATLSGGEKQRTAIARALVTRPGLLLADEPTGSLDSASGQQVFELLKQLNAEKGITILLASHAPEVAEYASRIVKLRDGRLDNPPK